MTQPFASLTVSCHAFPMPTKIATCYSNKYYAETPTASMRKLPVVAQAVEKAGLAELIDPGSIDPAKLTKLHDPTYVEAFLTGKGPLANSQGWSWTSMIRDGVLAIQAGQIRGTEEALKRGIAANVAQGFHHSTYARGGGFCTFNGLALVAQEFPELKVGVLDCDQHQGNGTAEFTERLPNLYNFTIYGASFGSPEYPRSLNRSLRRCTGHFERYQNALEEGFSQLKAWKVDLVVYQAGADPHIDDPYGSLGMSGPDMRLRDRLVFEFTKRESLPVLFVLAGGYQEPIETKLAPLHIATFEEASRIYG